MSRRVGRLGFVLALAVSVSLYVPASVSDAHVSSGRPLSQTRDGYGWLDYYRSLGGLGPVSRDPLLESRENLHVRYLADHSQACENDVHHEQLSAALGCPANPAATMAGELAASNSDITRVQGEASDRVAFGNWFSSAFHALTLLEPQLAGTGYAAYSTAQPLGAGPQAARFTASIDVYSERAGHYDGRVLAFPAQGKVSSLRSYAVGSESPEPFRSTLSGAPCHAWGSRQVVSAPVIIQRPVRAFASPSDGQLLDLTSGLALLTCSLTAADYPTTSAAYQFLSGRNQVTTAALYYADRPFQPGHRYQLLVAGQAVTEFSIATV
jgi:hypothetical protein